MDKEIVARLMECFKSIYSCKINSPQALMKIEQDLMEFLMVTGRELENSIFSEAGCGYLGAIVKHEGKRYRFVGNRKTKIHGLFGIVHYRRAYYRGEKKEDGSWIPLDEKMGIEKEHTPGLQFILSGFTAREVYQGSLDWFHQIFRPDGKDLISMRKALDMDYELGEKLKRRRQQEIEASMSGGNLVEKHRPILGRVAISIDAGKVREKLGEKVSSMGKKKYEIGFRDVKVAAISEVFWDAKNKEANCSNHSYVGGIEHADDFFPRVWAEMCRRAVNRPEVECVFLADGANWIWDRVAGIAPAGSVLILDFFHACEHVSTLCKELYGEGSTEYQRRFRRWRSIILKGKVQTFLNELKEIHANGAKGSARADLLVGEINYFTQNRHRMHYDKYREKRLPIGSGTIESCCKNVIAARMKRGGMTWSPGGADGMVQIRCSLTSHRFDADFKGILSSAA